MRLLRRLQMPAWWIVLWFLWAVSEGLRWRHSWEQASDGSLAFEYGWLVAGWCGLGVLAFAATRHVWATEMAGRDRFPHRAGAIVLLWLCVPSWLAFAGVAWLAGWGPFAAGQTKECAVALALVATAGMAAGGWAASQKTWLRAVAVGIMCFSFTLGACAFGLATELTPRKVADLAEKLGRDDPLKRLRDVLEGDVLDQLAKPAHILSPIWILLAAFIYGAWRLRRWKTPVVGASGAAVVTGLIAALLAHKIRPDLPLLRPVALPAPEVSIPAPQVTRGRLVELVSAQRVTPLSHSVWRCEISAMPIQIAPVELSPWVSGRLTSLRESRGAGASHATPDLSEVKLGVSADAAWTPSPGDAVQAELYVDLLHWRQVAELALHAGEDTCFGVVRARVLQITPARSGSDVRMELRAWCPPVVFRENRVHQEVSVKVVHVSPAGREADVYYNLHRKWVPTGHFVHLPLTFTVPDPTPGNSGFVRISLSRLRYKAITYDLQPEISREFGP